MKTNDEPEEGIETQPCRHSDNGPEPVVRIEVRISRRLIWLACGLLVGNIDRLGVALQLLLHHGS